MTTKGLPLVASSAFILPSFLLILPKSLAKFIGDRRGVDLGVVPSFFVFFSEWANCFGVRGERNKSGESPFDFPINFTKFDKQ